MELISVLTVDDHQMARDTFVAILKRQNDIEVVGQACDGSEGVESVAKLKPDVVTLDVSMPKLNGFDAARCIRRDSPSTRILMVSAYEDDPSIQQALEVGADGFVSKSQAAEKLAGAVHDVARGMKVFPSRDDGDPWRTATHGSSDPWWRQPTLQTATHGTNRDPR